MGRCTIGYGDVQESCVGELVLSFGFGTLRKASFSSYLAKKFCFQLKGLNHDKETKNSICAEVSKCTMETRNKTVTVIVVKTLSATKPPKAHS